MNKFPLPSARYNMESSAEFIFNREKSQRKRNLATWMQCIDLFLHIQPLKSHPSQHLGRTGDTLALISRIFWCMLIDLKDHLFGAFLSQFIEEHIIQKHPNVLEIFLSEAVSVESPALLFQHPRVHKAFQKGCRIALNKKRESKNRLTLVVVLCSISFVQCWHLWSLKTLQACGGMFWDEETREISNT